MKKVALFFTILIFTISCGKENLSLKENSEPSAEITFDLENRLLTNLEEIQVLSSKVIAFKISSDAQFRSNLIRKIFNANGYPMENVFLYDILNSINIAEIEGFLSSIDKSSSDYHSMTSNILNEYPLLVLKVPMWYGSTWSLEETNQFSYETAESQRLKFIPLIEDENQTKHYNSFYVDSNMELENEVINTNNALFDYIPVLIRVSEYHKLVSISDLTDQDGIPLLDQDDLTLIKNSSCKVNDILDRNLEYSELTKDGFSILNWIGFTQEAVKCRKDILSSSSNNSLANQNLKNNPEICDNNIDDDGDGLIDEADGDCCSFYANCYRDCISEDNYYEALKFVNNAAGLFHNYNPAFDDITGIRLVAYEFVGTAGAVPNSKNFFAPFMKLCGIIDLDPTVTGTINPSYDAFYKAQWTTVNSPPNYLGVSIPNAITGTFYLNLQSPLVVDVTTKWLDNWDGTTVGNRVRVEAFYLSSDVVSSSQQSTYVAQTATTLGVQFGVTSTPLGVNVGFNFSTTGTQTVTDQVTINVSPSDRSLGTFDMNYCESNSFFGLLPACSSTISFASVTGSHYSTGSLEVWSSIQ